GLAGSILAYKLLKAGKSVLVIDRGNKNSSSRVAAGLFHIMTFRRLIKTWLGDILIPYAHNFYNELTNELGESFLESFDLKRILNNEEERALWRQRIEDEHYQEWLAIADDQIEGVNSPFGFGIVRKAGRLNIPLFLDAMTAFLKLNGNLIEKAIDEIDVSYSQDEVKINSEGVSASNIVFCEGFHAKSNRLWSWLPIYGTKGEILDIEVNDLDFKGTINKKVFVMPTNKGQFKLGATYDWADKTLKTTSEAFEELSQAWGAIMRPPFKLLDHKAGIRPTVKDRRPILGRHPKHNNVWIFNGMGTKGVQLIPYFSEQMKNALIEGEDVHTEVDITRFYNEYRV
ncbi:MAG: FAD-binding oxidoreductase, partial [Flavobacteriales bacterium]|nr:FAD-binding oxidoreductase [Flavobacteriales bacterium]